MPPKINEKKKNPVLFTEVGNKPNKNKGLQHFTVTYIKHPS